MGNTSLTKRWRLCRNNTNWYSLLHNTLMSQHTLSLRHFYQ